MSDIDRDMESCWKREWNATERDNKVIVESAGSAIGIGNTVLLEERMDCCWKRDWNAIGR
jgi:hypothetical protein